MKIFPGGREAFSVVTSALFKKAAIKSWDWPMKTWETEEGRGWQDNQTKGRRLLLLPGYNPGGFPAFRSCARIGKQAADRGPDSTSGKDTSVEVWNFNEVHSVTTLSISPTQAGEKFFPGVGDGYVP